jgi:hypothetical protein
MGPSSHSFSWEYTSQLNSAMYLLTPSPCNLPSPQLRMWYCAAWPGIVLQGMGTYSYEYRVVIAGHNGRVVLRHEPSSPARTLRSWVRIPLETWMSVCVYPVFVLFCVQVAALQRADPPSKESYRLCIGLRNWKSCQGLTKGCRVIYIYIYRSDVMVVRRGKGSSS